MNEPIKKSQKDKTILRILYAIIVLVFAVAIILQYLDIQSWYNKVWFVIFIWPMVYVTYINQKYIKEHKIYFYIFFLIAVVITPISISLLFNN